MQSSNKLKGRDPFKRHRYNLTGEKMNKSYYIKQNHNCVGLEKKISQTGLLSAAQIMELYEKIIPMEDEISSLKEANANSIAGDQPSMTVLRKKNIHRSKN